MNRLKKTKYLAVLRGKEYIKEMGAGLCRS